MNASNRRTPRRGEFEGTSREAGRRWSPLQGAGGVVLAMALTSSLAATMAGCGGGGGSSGTKIGAAPGRSINASNAESAVKLTLEMNELVDVLSASWGLGGGVNEARCESGSGIGTVTDCVIGANTFSGAVVSTISEPRVVPVPGTAGSRSIPTQLELAITNLQWQSTRNSATYSVAGNLVVKIGLPKLSSALGTASVTGTLTLTDNATNIRYQYRALSQRYTITADEALHDYRFDQTDRKGSIVYMDENRAYSLGPGNLFDYFSLSGNDTKLALSTLLGNYAMRINTNVAEDDNYDTFGTMPLTELGKGHSVGGSPANVAVARQGGNSSLLDQGQAATLNATITDPDFNFHTLTWEIASAPAGATGDNAAVLTTVAQSVASQQFVAKIAGTYVVRATAREAGVTTDPVASSGEITLNVGLDAPEFSVDGLDGATGTIGQASSFPITLDNVEGTVTPTLLSAPAGMTLVGDANTGYQLQWTPKAQFFPATSETVALQVGNEDRSTVHTFTVTVASSAALPLVTPGLAVNSFTTDASITNVNGGSTSELVMAGNGALFYGLDLSGSAPSAVMANPYALDAEADTLMAIRPLRTNGVVTAYAVAGTKGVYVVNSNSFAVTAVRGLQFNATTTTSKHRFAVADVNNDNTDEIIALTKTASIDTGDQLYVMNQALVNLVPPTTQQDLGQGFLVGDVDSDDRPEIVCANGTIFSADTLAVQAEAGEVAGDKNYVLADVDGDGRKEIIEISTGEIVVTDVDTSAHTTIAVTFPVSGVENLNLFAFNADGDADDELVIGTADNRVLVYSLNMSGPSATLDRTIGNTVANNPVTEVMTGNVTGNSDNEIVFVSRNGNAPRINVSALDGTILMNGASQTLLTGNFVAARPQKTAINGGFFTASTLRSGVTAVGKGLLSVAATGAPTDLGLDIAADTAVFATSTDIDSSSTQDLLASTQLRNDADMSILAQLTGASAWQLPITAGTPAPIAVAQIDGVGSLDAVYVERTGAIINETVSLVVHQVNGTELDRIDLQTSGPIAAEPVAIAVANLDGDANPDIVLLEATRLRSYEYSNGNLQLVNDVALTGASAIALAVGDANGDGKDEIAIIRSGNDSVVQVYSSALVLQVQAATTQPRPALWYYAAAGSRPVWLAGTGNAVAALDAQTLRQLWKSPALNGDINSVDVIPVAGVPQLRVGTANAIYRSR